MSYGQRLIDANIEQLRMALHLLGQISDHDYALNEHRYFGSGIGKHMRHILDHYQSFLEGLPQKVDYDARQRDSRLEDDRGYAREKIAGCIEKLRALRDEDATLELRLPVNSNEGRHDAFESPWAESTVKRELQFLLSHTVHHYALIALLLRILGHSPDERFGVAPSTLTYQAQEQQQKQS